MTDTQREDFASGLQSAPNTSEKALGDYYCREGKRGIWGKLEGMDGEEILLPDLMTRQQS